VSVLESPCSAIAQNWWPPKPSPGYNIFSVEQERWLAELLARKAGLDKGRLDDAEASEFVQNLGERLVKQSKRPEMQYKFFLQNASGINACTVGGGQIYVNRGMIEFCGNEAELAYVVAHEIAHDALRHMPKTISRWLTWGIGVDEVGGREDIDRKIAMFEKHLHQTGAFQVASDLLFGIKRGDEVWADKYAVWNMYTAGYDPKAAVGMMERLIKEKGDLPEVDSLESLMKLLMSSHPPTRDRIDLIKLELIWMGKKLDAIVDTEEFRALRRHL
jgi:predicted Zn-dependent protease